ncbi:hypothetical protein QJS04_geneDACA018312 [Acorus gramineus]|uniref:Uncharacterized protein n=1 Tax=Acorus gramineus TaxID=55184 RepID=A0AAV9BA56_ACOGR|nr:hypothetical protein QJS04_geneDACA018312 [Acorus gramineus]
MGSPSSSSSSSSSSTSCFFRYPLVSFSVLLLLFLGCFSCFTSSACLVSMFMGSSALLYFHFINKNGVKKAISIEKTSEDPEDELLLIDGTEHLISKDESSDDDDDESLIEIALQEGHYMTIPDGCSPEFFLGQHRLKELFSDVGEEENLIEIDISMGSIKCS